MSSSVMTRLPSAANCLRQAVDQVDLRADGELVPAGASFTSLDEAFGGAECVRLLADFPAAFGMHDDLDAGILRANLVHVLGQKTLVDGAVPLPEHDLRRAQAVGRRCRP